MDVKDVIATAKAYVRDIYDETERVSDLSLEEVAFDPTSQQWLITVEFSRPANSSIRTRMRELAEMGGGDAVPRRRVQKVVVVSDRNGSAVAMRNREAA